MSDTTTTEDAFNAALAAAQSANARKDMVAVEAELRKAYALQPNNGVVLGYIGSAVSQQGRTQEAIPILEQAVRLGTQPNTLVTLAQQYEKAGAVMEAWQMYKQFLKHVPNHTYALMQLGGLKDQMGDKPGARDCYRLAYESSPDDLTVTMKYTNAMWAKEPEKALGLSERLLDVYKDDPVTLSGVLTHVICQKEWWERIKRGLMPYHCSRVDELFFQHAQHYVKQLETTCRTLLEQYPDQGGVKTTLATSLFAQKDRQGAEAALQAAAPKIKGHIFETVRFSPAFYDELRAMSDEDLVRGLPPLISVTPPVPNAKGVLYLSCNFTYFTAFALPMIVSLLERSPQTPVHVHVMDADETQTQHALAFLQKMAPLKFSLSVERTGLREGSAEARCYYHAVRFIRYYQHLKMYGCPLWLMDVDALVHSNLDDLFSMLSGHDASMRIRPGRLEPWNQFNACIVGASQSAMSLEYFRLIAAYIAHFHQANMLRWGIDQLAMYGVYADMEDRGAVPSLALLGEREVDYDYRDDGFVWCNSGAGKFKHLRRISNPQAMPLANFEENRFLNIFEQRWKDVQTIAASLSLRP